MASGRCRKCRRLICKDCVSSGSFQAPEGFLCRECEAPGPAASEPAAAEPSPTPWASRGVKWFWLAAALLLLAVFAGLVAYPYWRAVRWQKELQAEDAESRSAAGRALAEIGDGPALRVLRDTAESGSTLARLAAIDGLGWCRHPAAAEVLRQLAADAAAPEAVRLAAEEALCRYEQMRQAAGSPSPP
ncbi:MAG: HEAT repeat domain-containing protein [Planctomycetota bacterium]|nr:HEAT repeat domain-containing protein [Planctomycetota bacterium]